MRQLGNSIGGMQGDTISGRLSRADVATVVLAALKRPSAANTTFEARRTTRTAVGGPATFDEVAQNREFLKLSQGARPVYAAPIQCRLNNATTFTCALATFAVFVDFTCFTSVWHRADRLRRQIALPPMPEFVSPPPELSDDEKKEVLDDPRVKRASSKNDEVLTCAVALRIALTWTCET